MKKKLFRVDVKYIHTNIMFAEIKSYTIGETCIYLNGGCSLSSSSKEIKYIIPFHDVMSITITEE
jgi:hypothetical protein